MLKVAYDACTWNNWKSAPAGTLADLMEEFNERVTDFQPHAVVSAGHNTQHDCSGSGRSNDSENTCKDVVPDFWSMVRHRTIMAVALASLAHGIRASSVGGRDGSGFPCVLATGNWLVGPTAMGTHQARFACAYTQRTLLNLTIVKSL